MLQEAIEGTQGYGTKEGGLEGREREKRGPVIYATEVRCGVHKLRRASEDGSGMGTGRRKHGQ